MGVTMGHLPEHGGRSDSLVLHRQLGRRRLLPVRHHHHDHHQNSAKVRDHVIMLFVTSALFSIQMKM